MAESAAIATIRELNEVFERERVVPEFVIEFDGGGPLEESRHDGLNDWMSVWRRWLSAFDDYRLEVGEYEQLGAEVVLVDVVDRGRGRASGLEIDLAQTQVWRTREGRLLYCGVFADRGRALAAGADLARATG
jgi:hypothetical protein